MTQIAFGDYVLDSRSGDVRRAGLVVELRPKLYALLAYLVEHAGELVAKDQLISAVWRETHVADGSLNRAITELRDALGDDADQPRFIETVPRRGYRFIAEVKRSDATRKLSPFIIIYGERHIALFEGENIVGRTPECEVQIPAGSVSRRHARIIAADKVSIEDLGSTNGTEVRGAKISSPIDVESGDDIRIGKETVRLISQHMLTASTDRLA